MTDGHGALNALSIDVEDWFHSQNVKGRIDRSAWETLPATAERNTMRILEILEERKVNATFFVLGWIAERHPGLVRAIAESGHEIASHGYHHDLVYTQSQGDFRTDVARSRALLEDMTGLAVVGYRAPCFSITEWAIDILQEEGYTYDSSMMPALAHDRYGKLDGIDARQAIVPLREGFQEVCISCLSFGGRGVPWGGGGYFRLAPLALWMRGIANIHRSGLPYIFYIHPWEIDPEHPCPSGIGAMNRFRQRVNLGRCEARFAALAGAFEWTTIHDLVARWREGRPAPWVPAAAASTSGHRQAEPLMALGGVVR